MTDKKKVLVVEDNLLNRKLLKDLLSVNGYEVIEADNAEDGLIIVNSEIPDLILLDYQLPRMNGLQMFNVLKADKKTSGIHVVFVTASVFHDELIKLKETGCLIIFKPINTRTFIKEIEQDKK
jgi:CheY-like chemotaxis protein